MTPSVPLLAVEPEKHSLAYQGGQPVRMRGSVLSWL
jgi:hypothetical protein